MHAAHAAMGPTLASEVRACPEAASLTLPASRAASVLVRPRAGVLEQEPTQQGAAAVLCLSAPLLGYLLQVSTASAAPVVAPSKQVQ